MKADNFFKTMKDEGRCTYIKRSFDGGNYFDWIVISNKGQSIPIPSFLHDIEENYEMNSEEIIQFIRKKV